MHRDSMFWLLAVICVVVATYISSYLVLSRRGFAQANRMRVEGFYFLTPRDTNTWRQWNYGLARFYAPLIALDNGIGTGRQVASEPLWEIAPAAEPP